MVLFQLLHSIFRPFSSDDKTLAFSTISQFEANRTFKAFKWLMDKLYGIIISSFPHWHQFQGVCHLFDWKILKFVFQTRKPLGTRHCGTLEFHRSRNLSTKKCFFTWFFSLKLNFGWIFDYSQRSYSADIRWFWLLQFSFLAGVSSPSTHPRKLWWGIIMDHLLTQMNHIWLYIQALKCKRSLEKYLTVL